ncbi:hypothetical protein K493DRAFT_412306 [Basidiobolus meristosporus CBS 931.73]|uniref:DNA mismatch repair protein S5 domain-containing protein n=1 Tax=Basidiobolus meristosporus CBS 931.73 TaxID=1314790 RepID=A0A1Y1X055_9FUNG|nr:hypothetical protein K493DRAFT_412306 [Basidiobolus meristosporus CBS 931.73]|eukprot:ORX78978.1 hypothetical protein K493DRAFT_412306 [Basidiobolus meristosporus CBS 931.73]
MIQPLEKETVRKISSGQVIIEVDNVVKELFENALDAKATSITVRLVDGGLTSISVKDNGQGIPISDRPNMAKRYYTSKIEKFEDLDSVSSYGFRGEALNSICAACQLVQITTKTPEDPTAIIYDLDKTGAIVSSKSVGGEQGTTVNALKLFQYFPVRRQVAQKTVNNAIKRIMDCLMSYALIHPTIRLSFKNTEVSTKKRGPNKKEWIKISTKHIMESITAVFGKELTSQLLHKTEAICDSNNDATGVTLEVVLPKRDSDSAIVCKGDRSFFYINERPVSANKGEMKQILGKIRDKYNSISQEDAGTKKSPFVLFHIRLPLGSFDVNVEPSKNVVLLHRPEAIFQIVDDFLDEFYAESAPIPPQTIANEGASTPASPEAQRQQPEQVTNEHTLRREEEAVSADTESTPAAAQPMPNNEDGVQLRGIFNDNRDTSDDKLSFLPTKLIAREDWSKGHVEGLNNPVLVCSANAGLENDEKELAEVSRNRRAGDSLSRPSLRLGHSNDSNTSKIYNHPIAGPSRAFDDSSKSLDNALTGVEFESNPFVSHYSSNRVSASSPFTLKLNSSADNEPDLDEEFSPERLKTSSVTFNDDLNRTSADGPQSSPKFTPSSRHYPIFDPEHRRSRMEAEQAYPSDDDDDESYSVKRKSVVTTTLTPTKRHRAKLNPFERLMDANQLTLHELLKSPSSCKMVSRKRALGMVDTLHEELSHTFNLSATGRKYRTIRKRWEKKASARDENDLLPQPLYRFIGNVDKFWVIKNENDLLIVDPIRSQYPYLHTKLMESYEFALAPLESPILVSPNSIGGLVNLNFLSKLPSTEEGFRYTIQDRRVLANGFELCLTKGPANKTPLLEVTAMATQLPTLGISDLSELISLLVEHKSSQDLTKTRIAKAVAFFEEESNRLAKLSLQNEHIQEIVNEIFPIDDPSQEITKSGG